MHPASQKIWETK
uniref:Uncharacterized protein n=1 Tax=Arundo donax TaxID=35708 RepID=A0A0A9EGC0_ARUDO